MQQPGPGGFNTLALGGIVAVSSTTHLGKDVFTWAVASLASACLGNAIMFAIIFALLFAYSEKEFRPDEDQIDQGEDQIDLIDQINQEEDQTNQVEREGGDTFFDKNLKSQIGLQF